MKMPPRHTHPGKEVGSIWAVVEIFIVSPRPFWERGQGVRANNSLTEATFLLDFQRRGHHPGTSQCCYPIVGIWDGAENAPAPTFAAAALLH